MNFEFKAKLYDEWRRDLRKFLPYQVTEQELVQLRKYHEDMEKDRANTLRNWLRNDWNNFDQITKEWYDIFYKNKKRKLRTTQWARYWVGTTNFGLNGGGPSMLFGLNGGQDHNRVGQLVIKRRKQKQKRRKQN